MGGSLTGPIALRRAKVDNRRFAVALAYEPRWEVGLV